MPRRIVVIACAAAGIYLLLGLGWALLALAVLVEVGWPRQHAEVPSWMEPWQRNALKAWRRAQAIPQQIGAVTSAGSGMALVPVGVGLFAGVGPALVVLGVLALGLGLLLDRTA